MRIAWLVAANRGDVLWAGGEADHQAHLRTHETVMVLWGHVMGSGLTIDRAVRIACEM